MDVLEGLQDVTTAFHDRYIDANTVTGYSGTADGLISD